MKEEGRRRKSPLPLGYAINVDHSTGTALSSVRRPIPFGTDHHADYDGSSRKFIQFDEDANQTGSIQYDSARFSTIREQQAQSFDMPQRSLSFSSSSSKASCFSSTLCGLRKSLNFLFISLLLLTPIYYFAFVLISPTCTRTPIVTFRAPLTYSTPSPYCRLFPFAARWKYTVSEETSRFDGMEDFVFDPSSIPAENKLPGDPYSSADPGKMAFLFLTRSTILLAPLWEQFFKGHERRYSIYVHSSDPSFEISAHNTHSPIFLGRQVPSGEVLWGDITMVDAERRLLELSLLDPDNLYFALVSETCIPLWSFQYIYNYVATTPVSFLERFDCPLNIGFGRYMEGMGPEIKKKDFKKGSQWFVLQRRHAMMVIDDRKVYFKFQKHCKPRREFKNCYSDEHYLQTLFQKKDPGGVSNYTVTFADWTERKWHPMAYSAENTTALLIRQIKSEDRYIAWRPYWHRIRKSYKSHLVRDPSTGKPVKDYDNGYCSLGSEHRHCFLFARKFMPSTLPGLLNLSHVELGF
ncbi:hypothetical protein CLOM_g10487 [Closterium sp. NIES-68]|nr:hypothetical protein CLOM_g10487 [Closterium sp. NIES-68]GJP82874.1 hypothetical protein CLOP_g13100 [Closterium sp. NIES-67]